MKRVNKIKALLSFLAGAGLTALLSGEAIAQTALTGDATALNNIMGQRLTAADMQNLMCFGYYRSVYYANQIPGLTDDQICRIISNHATFWSTTQTGVYRLRFTTASGIQDRFYFNPLALLNINNSLATGLFGHGNANMPILAVINLDNYTGGGTPVPAFRLPPNYTPAASSNNVLQLIPTSNFISNRGAIGALRLLRLGNTTSPVTISFTTTGTAVRGTDYTLFDPRTDSTSNPTPGSAFTGSSFTFPANTPAVQLAFQSIVPTTSQPREFLSFNLASLPTGYGVAASPNTISYIEALTIYDVAISVVGTATVNRGQSTAVRISRTGGDNSQPLTVNYTLGGTATNGTDYTFLDGNAVIPAGQASVDVPISTSAPSSAQPQENITLTLVDTAAYNLTAQNGTTITLQPFTPSQVSISPAGSATLTPGSSNNGFVISRTGDTTQAIAVTYNVGGTAQAGVDYSQLPGSATIPAGASSVTVPVTVPQRSGTTAIPEKAIQLTLTQGNGYTLSSSIQQILTIPEYTPLLSSITVSASNGGQLNRGQSGNFTITRTGGDQTQPLAVGYALGGTAQQGTDYIAPGGSTGTLTIPAGQSTITLPISALSASGSTAISEKSVQLTIQSGTGYTGAGQQGAMTIAAYTPPSVSLSSPSGGTLTPGTNNDAFTVTRTGDTSQPLTVPYTVSGTAVPDQDYTALPGSVTIPAGQSSATVRINVPSQSGSTAQPAKTVAIALDPGNSYAVDSGNANGTYTIPAYTPPSVSMSSPSGGTLTPGTNNDAFTVTRTGSTSQPLTIPYTVSGTAVPDQDYTALPGTVTIPAGQSSATVRINVPVQSGSTAQPAKTVAIALDPGSNYAVDSNSGNGTYTIPAYTPAAVPQVSFSVPSGGSTTITPSTPGGFTVTRAGADNSQPMTVNYTLGGTAQNGVDYQQLPGSVTIPAGQDSATVPIVVPNRPSADGKTIAVNLASGSGYQPGSTTGLNYTIDVPPAPVQATPVSIGSLSNPFPSFIASRPAGSSTSPVELPYTVGGTAVPGVDYAPLSGRLTLPAGQASGVVPVQVLPGATAGRTIELTFSAPSGYTLTNPNASETISSEAVAAAKNPSPVLSAGGLNNPLSFTVTRTGSTAQPATIRYTTGGTAEAGVDYQALPGTLTIPAGQSTGVIPVRLLPGARPGRTISIQLQPQTGYQLGDAGQTQTITQEAIAAANPQNPNPQTNITAQSQVDPTRFVIVRSGSTEQALTLRYTTGGTAEPGVDYEPLPGVVTIPAGQSNVQIPVRTLPGARPGRTITLQLQNPITGEAVLSAITLEPGETPTPPTLPPATQPTTSSNGGNGGNSLLPLLGAGSAVGGALLLGTEGNRPTTVAACPANAGGAIAQLRQMVGDKELSSLSLRTLVSPEGIAAADQFTLGDLADYLRSTTLGDVQRMSGSDLSRVTLAASGLFPDTTLGGLIRTAYSNAKTVGDVPGLAEYLVTRQAQALGSGQVASRQGGGAAVTVDELKQLAINELLTRYPSVARVNLGGMAIAQVPGLMQMPISQIPNAGGMALSRIPGLDKAPLNQLLPCLAEGNRVGSGGLTGR